MHAPYICTGEAAVIDAADTELVLGRLYLYQQIRGDHIWHITAPSDFWKTDSDEPMGMLCPLNKLKPREGQTVDQALDELCRDAPRDKVFGLPMPELFLSDGPLPLDWIAERIIGCVVGVL